ncbi:MAG TPA: hypothetical protein VEP90_15940, partial [Methylomirabilota bacterium]|nr:hypothetical protein [Methylomirabilota bacterium]
MIITIPLIAADGAISTVTLPDPVINQPMVNVLQSPNDLTQSVWSKGGVVVTYNSTNDASNVIENTSAGYHYASQAFNGLGGLQNYSISARFAPLGRSVYLYITDGTNGAGSEFVLTGNGSTQLSGTSGTGFAISNIAIAPPDAQGFYLCTMTISTAASPLFFDVFLENSSNNTNYTGVGNIGCSMRDLSVIVQAVQAGIFYVAANGSDSNMGTQAAPWQTINKVNSRVFAPGSAVYFRGGDTFTGNLTPQVLNGSGSNPVVFGSYGIGRATINPSVGGFGQGIVNLDGGLIGVTIQDFILSAPNTAIQPRGGIRIGNNSGIAAGYYVIQRCNISGIRFNTYVSSDFGAEIMCELSPGSGGINNVIIKNCDIHGLSGVNSLDDAGITGFGGQSASNWTLVGNLVYNIGCSGTASLYKPGGTGQSGPPQGNGIHQNGISNALNKYNIVHDMAGNFNDPAAGPCAYTTNSASGVTIRFCEGYRVRPTDGTFASVDFVGIDFDTETSDSLAEFNFMHGCYGVGYYFFSTGGPWNNNMIRYNLGYNNVQEGRPGLGELGISIPAGTNPTITMDHNKTFNNRVYSGPLYHNTQQGACCIGMVNDGGFSGSVSNNIQITGWDNSGYQWEAWKWNTNSPDINVTATITGNQWFGLPPSSYQPILTWRNIYYSDLVSWQTASGKSGNSIANNSAGPNIFATTATLSLSSSERTTAIAALTSVENISGIETGTTDYGMSLPGSRM